MSSTRAVVVDPKVAGRLTIQTVEAPTARTNEALVKVEAISLNRGEVKRAMAAEAGWRPGWDFAGTVIQEAQDGSGPKKGNRVVGMIASGAWAEEVAAPTDMLGIVPKSVTFSQAATLPVAGLTALRALEKGGLLLKKRVLVTGSTGGVGYYGIQLAKQSGAHVVGIARTVQKERMVRDAGAEDVIVGEDMTEVRKYGPFDLILESVGGQTLANALPLLAPDGTCVTFGASEAAEVTINVQNFYPIGRASLYGLILFAELRVRPGGQDLTKLAELIAEGKLTTQIDVEASWNEIGEIAQKLIKREYTGKAVLLLQR